MNIQVTACHHGKKIVDVNGTLEHEEWDRLLSLLQEDSVEVLSLDSVHYSRLYIIEEDQPSFADILSKNTSITTLRLKASFLGKNSLAQIIQAVSRHPTLKSLTVRDYFEDIGNSGIDFPFTVALSNLLVFNKTITTLELDHLTLNIDLSQICQAIQISKSLEKLSLRYLKLSPSNLTIMKSALEKNTSIRHLISDSCAPELAAMIAEVNNKKSGASSVARSLSDAINPAAAGNIANPEPWVKAPNCRQS